jgi:hypothetical protein
MTKRRMLEAVQRAYELLEFATLIDGECDHNVRWIERQCLKIYIKGLRESGAVLDETLVSRLLRP